MILYSVHLDCELMKEYIMDKLEHALLKGSLVHK